MIVSILAADISKLAAGVLTKHKLERDQISEAREMHAREMHAREMLAAGKDKAEDLVDVREAEL